MFRLSLQGKYAVPQTVKNSNKLRISFPNTWSKEHYLPPQKTDKFNKKTLILDLDETLVHSTPIPQKKYAMAMKAMIDGKSSYLYISFRPYVEDFLQKVCEMFEVIIYTASLRNYADLVIDKLDPKNKISFRLYREHCTPSPYGLIKDLSNLGRNLKDVIIVDNSPVAYEFHKENAIPISTWMDDENDVELLRVYEILTNLEKTDDIRKTLEFYKYPEIRVNPNKIRILTNQPSRQKFQNPPIENPPKKPQCLFIRYKNQVSISNPPQDKPEKIKISLMKTQQEISTENKENILIIDDNVAKIDTQPEPYNLKENIKNNDEKFKNNTINLRKLRRLAINASTEKLLTTQNTPKNEENLERCMTNSGNRQNFKGRILVPSRSQKFTNLAENNNSTDKKEKSEKRRLLIILRHPGATKA